jgi:hypothetical protein
MHGAIPPLPQYTCMAWCSVRKSTGTTSPLHYLRVCMKNSFGFRAGIDGRSCIKRALCETAQRLMPRASILEEMLRILFT